MAWVTPSTKSTGLLITAAIWNEQVYGNIGFLGFTHDHSGDPGDGAAVNTVPAGLILIFDTSCPYGWTRVSAFDGKFIRGSSTYGTLSGTDTHVHTYPAHAHSHTHATGYAESVPDGTVNYDHGSGGLYYIASGTHTNHAIAGLDPTGTYTNSQAAGNSNAPSTTSLPPYLSVVFCRKN